jgi:hypothetical protein
MGYFVQDFTPYWWIDGWLYEIATMIGRNLYVPIEVEMIAPARTRGLREFGYWYGFMDDMRIHRRAIAESILSSPDFLVSDERRRELREDLDRVCAEFGGARQAALDPANIARVEARGYDGPEDERYQRVKARSIQVLREWQTRGSVAA